MPQPRKHSDNAERQRAYRERASATLRETLREKGLPCPPVIATMPGTNRWKVLHHKAQASLAQMLEEMQTYYDERTEQWQESDKGDEFQQKMENIQSALDALEQS